ncbi:MAG: ABC transporter permease [Candidatus Promineifilaceae bacterium]
MALFQNIRIALNGLEANKLRAALTMLGIMIGVAAVITLLSIGDGVNRFVADQFIGLGTNLVFIVSSDDPNQLESTLTVHDVETLSDPAVVPDAVGIAPIYFRTLNLQYQGTEYSSIMRATTPAYAAVRGYEMTSGRFIDDNDYNGRSRVAVLGPETAKNLFPDDIDPVGAEIKVQGVTFRVVGLLESKGGNVFGSQDDLVIIPLTTAQERLFNGRSQRTGDQLVDMIMIQAVNSQGVQNVIIDAENALRQNHNITFRDEDDFLMLTQQDFLSAFGEVTNVLTLFLGAIAGISLLVGGIGIMNIMLVSVTERTREIGLRKAVGAKRRDILGQFLTEAIVMSLLGGFLGIILGVAGSAGVHLAVPELNTSVTAESILLAVGFSAVVGLFFGIYPATRAAALHPIDALRFE